MHNNAEPRDRAGPGASDQFSVELGKRIRQARLAQGLRARELATAAGVSASLISQVERGKALPSVGTLVALAARIGISLDEICHGETAGDAVDSPAAAAPSGVSTGSGAGDGPVQRAGERSFITLANGISWERLTPNHDPDGDFLVVTYAVGAESCPPEALMTYPAKNYALVLEGCLGATIDDSSWELQPGDSLVFEGRLPHRFWTVGDSPAIVAFTILRR